MPATSAEQGQKTACMIADAVVHVMRGRVSCPHRPRMSTRKLHINARAFQENPKYNAVSLILNIAVISRDYHA